SLHASVLRTKPRLGGASFFPRPPRCYSVRRLVRSRAIVHMQPQAARAFPAELRARAEQVRASLAPLSLPPEVAASAPLVATVSEFVLRVLERHSAALAERLRDTAPL